MILIVTVVVFIMFHMARVLISIYEAFTIKQMIVCGEKGLGYYHIWYLYAQSVAQILQVRISQYEYELTVVKMQ